MTDLESDFILDDLAEEVFPYLDDLRESGETNMFGAPRYIMEEFGVDKQMAYRVVEAWMNSFKPDVIKKTDEVSRKIREANSGGDFDVISSDK